MKIALILAAGLTATQLSAAPVDWSKLPPPATNSSVTFDQDIAPIFKASCVRCHGAERPRDLLRLDSLAGVLKGTKQGPILTAGDSANSLLVKAVSRLDPQTAMPPRRGPRGPGGPRGPMGTNAPATPPPDGGPMGGPEAGGPPPTMGGDNDHGPGGPPPGGEGFPPPGGGPEGMNGMNGTNGPGGRPPRNFGPPPKPLTAEQVGLLRAWIDQGAK
jgi:hypothetical protein